MEQEEQEILVHLFYAVHHMELTVAHQYYHQLQQQVEEEVDLQDVDLLVDQEEEIVEQVILLQLILHKVIQVELEEVFQVMVAEEVVEQELLEQLEIHQDQEEQVVLELQIVFQDQQYHTLEEAEVEHLDQLLVEQEEQHLLAELEELDLELVQEELEQLIEVEAEDQVDMLQDKQVVMEDRVLLLLEHQDQQDLLFLCHQVQILKQHYQHQLEDVLLRHSRFLERLQLANNS